MYKDIEHIETKYVTIISPSVPGGAGLCLVTHDTFFLSVGYAVMRAVADVFFSRILVLLTFFSNSRSKPFRSSLTFQRLTVRLQAQAVRLYKLF